jgi:hypothetical protein
MTKQLDTAGITITGKTMPMTIATRAGGVSFGYSPTTPTGGYTESDLKGDNVWLEQTTAENRMVATVVEVCYFPYQDFSTEWNVQPQYDPFPEPRQHYSVLDDPTPDTSDYIHAASPTLKLFDEFFVDLSSFPDVPTNTVFVKVMLKAHWKGREGVGEYIRMDLYDGTWLSGGDIYPIGNQVWHDAQDDFDRDSSGNHWSTTSIRAITRIRIGADRPANTVSVASLKICVFYIVPSSPQAGVLVWTRPKGVKVFDSTVGGWVNWGGQE